MGCKIEFVKYTMFAFNFLFWILGLCVLGIGIYSLVETGDYEDVFSEGSNPFKSAGNLLIACGIFVAILGFVGCWGAIKHNKICLFVYMAFIVLIFVMELAAGIYSYLKKDKVIHIVEGSLKTIIFTNYGKGGKVASGMDKGVDWLQQKLSCCGFTNSSDWKNNSNWESAEHKGSVPSSCCKGKPAKCKREDAFTQGCRDPVHTFLLSNVKYLGAVGVGIAFVQLLGLVIAIVLYRHDKFAEHEQLA